MIARAPRAFSFFPLFFVPWYIPLDLFTANENSNNNHNNKKLAFKYIYRHRNGQIPRGRCTDGTDCARSENVEL